VDWKSLIKIISDLFSDMLAVAIFNWNHAVEKSAAHVCAPEILTWFFQRHRTNENSKKCYENLPCYMLTLKTSLQALISKLWAKNSLYNWPCAIFVRFTNRAIVILTKIAQGQLYKEFLALNFEVRTCKVVLSIGKLRTK
jgi:hypothetical protein